MEFLNEFLITIFNYYNANNGTYQAEVQQVNENTAPGAQYRFNPDLPPYFYSGNLFVINQDEYIVNSIVKMVFITMNPQQNDNVLNWAPGSVNLDRFLCRQNNWFISDEATNRAPSAMYLNCQNFLQKFHDLEQAKGRYKLIHENNGVIIDWFPFYSPNFKLTGHEEWNDLPLNYLNHILSLQQHLPETPFIAVGGAIRDILAEIGDNQEDLNNYVKKVTLNNRTIYCIPKLANPGVGAGDELVSAAVDVIKEDMQE